jgi:hypothetical protein
MTNLNLDIIVLAMFRLNDVLPYDIVFLSIRLFSELSMSRITKI